MMHELGITDVNAMPASWMQTMHALRKKDIDTENLRRMAGLGR